MGNAGVDENGIERLAGRRPAVSMSHFNPGHGRQIHGCTGGQIGIDLERQDASFRPDRVSENAGVVPRGTAQMENALSRCKPQRVDTKTEKTWLAVEELASR